MVVKRSDIEKALESKERDDTAQFEAIIDKALAEQWARNALSICLPREPSDAARVNLESRYQRAGWNLQFKSGRQYNDFDYCVVVSACVPPRYVDGPD